MDKKIGLLRVFVHIGNMNPSPESSCRVLKLSVLSIAVTRRATQIIHDCRSAGERGPVSVIFHDQCMHLMLTALRFNYKIHRADINVKVVCDPEASEL